MTTQNDAVMEFDPSIVDEIDQSSVERNEAEYPTIQWHRGDPKMKKYGGMDYQGGWFIAESQAPFIAESQAPADLTAFGWQKVTWTHDNGDETDGYYIRELTISVIRDRQRWEVFENNTRSIFAWKDYDSAKAVGRASGRSHTLVLIKGMEALGPFVLTLRGLAGVYFFNRKNSPKSALGTFDSIVVRAGNDAVKRSGRKGLMPRRAFWLTVGASRNADGSPLFIEVGSGKDTSTMVVPQALGLPDKAEQVNVAEYFVGRDLLNQASQLWNEANDWAKAWDDIAPGSTDGAREEVTSEKSTPTENKTATEATDEEVAALGF